MSTPLLRADRLSFAYPDSPVILSDLSFEICYGDFIGVIGPNGGGKTTLMKGLLGLLSPLSGALTYYTREGAVTKQPHIGYVPQQNMIDREFPITVAETVAYGLMGFGVSRLTRALRTRIDTVLDQVGMLEERATSIGALSGGQVQRVLLARAIVSEPDLLILDEPNTYVDKHFESQLYELLPLVNHRSAIMIVSHDIGSISRMVHRLFCVNRHLHIHESIDGVGEECPESGLLRYVSLLDHD